MQLLLQANRKQVLLQRNGGPLLRTDHQDCRTMLRWDDQSVKKIVDNGKWCESSLSERLDVKKNCFIKDCDKNSATNLTSLIDEVRQNPFFMNYKLLSFSRNTWHDKWYLSSYRLKVSDLILCWCFIWWQSICLENEIS